MSDLVIETLELSKKYKKSDSFSLENLNIKVKAGEVYGYLGPNGAGKSTTIRLIMDFIRPNSGKSLVLGVDSREKDFTRARYDIGYLSGDFAGYPKSKGGHFLKYLSDLSGQNNDKNIKHLSKILDVDLEKPIGALSKGNRQKIGLIQAFMGQPKLLILDEPTSGLDPLKQEVFYDLVKQAKDRGAGVFISSHNLSEVHKMCDRVGIIRQGRLVYEGDTADISNRSSHKFDIQFAVKPPLSEIKRLPEVLSVEAIGKELRIIVSGNLSNFLKYISKYQVIKLETSDFDLEEQFMQFYEEQKL